MSFLVTRITRLRYFVVTGLAALVLIASPGSARVFAWGAVGHHVVARIAWALMTQPARERASALLGGGQDVFVAAATWADEIRSSRPETYNWHFVDIPVDARSYDPARDCPWSDKGDCVIAEIARARAELADASRSDALRAESLKFLIHFVGDLHQPLHAIDNHDRGGNDVKVMALRGEDGRNTNLHSAWDTGLINLSDETEAARAARLVEALKARPESPSLDVTGWVLESHAIAVAHTYHYPGFSPKGPPADPVALDEAYRAQAIKDIDQQLTRGGARLAALLNSLLAPPR
jgi:hypothetical protein